jgi:hypothetical protein
VDDQRVGLYTIDDKEGATLVVIAGITCGDKVIDMVVWY